MIAAVGVVARLRQLTAGRSLWLDETFVALDLQQQTLMESLIDGSPRNQLAPAGFWAVSHAAETVSSAEWVLRAFPFVGGLVLVALAVVYAERHLASVAARVLLVATVAWRLRKKWKINSFWSIKQGCIGAWAEKEYASSNGESRTTQFN